MEHKQLSPQNYVSLVLGEEIRVNHVTANVARWLEAIGARECIVNGELVWVVKADDEQALGEMMGQLRDMGVLFAGGPAGWPPAEVFDYLREKGVIEGEFQEVLWRGPGNWFIRAR